MYEPAVQARESSFTLKPPNCRTEEPAKNSHESTKMAKITMVA